LTSSPAAAAPQGDAAWLGIDLGTQGVRATLVDATGSILGSGSAPLVRDHRDGAIHEQDPAEWWTALCQATRQATAPLRGRELGGVAIDSTSGTILVQDASGAAHGPAVMYDDGRAGPEALEAQSAGEELWAALGQRIQRSWALPKALWLVRHGLVGHSGRIVHQADHVAAKLTGAPVATDSSHALKMGLDLVNLRWPSDIFDRLGLDELLLPEVVLPGVRIGEVCAAAASETGIPVGAPLRAGMTDGCAAQIAVRAMLPGSWSTALGTTLVVKGSSLQPIRDPSGAVYNHVNPDGGWLPGGASSTGAGVIRRDFADADLDALTGLAAGHEPAPGVMYPLVGRGERFPFLAPEAVGFSEGVGDEPGARFAATLQSVAFVERLAYDVLRSLGADTTGPATFSGGATRNRHWNQLRADVLGRPVLLTASAEASLGMAVLAAAPPGRLGRTAEAMVRVVERLEPDPTRGARLEEGYRRFVDALVARGWLDPANVRDEREAA
jgi:sugar (pentulose or hexulose) kinase